MRIPRFMIAAPKSGSGKTLITCGLINALKKRDIDVVTFKCGPDYIDPMFHRTLQNVKSENLDTFFTDETATRKLFADSAAGHDMAVMEGVMGLFDGVGGIQDQGSAYHLAMVTDTPIILVVDVHGMGRSMIPYIQGFINYDKRHLIKGIILNRMSASFYKTMQYLLATEIDVPVLGYFPEDKTLNLESRHLGLMLPEEIDELKNKLDKAAEYIMSGIDMEKLAIIGTKAGEVNVFEEPDESDDYRTGKDITLAVARDSAFCFYYDANIREFIKKGVRIKYFSPLNDEHLPSGISGILLGGGYPENYGEQLSSNKSMLSDIKNAINEGIPSLAECGGFMYLHNSMTDVDGNTYEMVGAVDGRVSYQGKLVRFGYVEISEKEACFMEEEHKIKGHEFHYYDSTDNGNECVAEKPTGNKNWKCIHKGDNYFWGFPHLYYPSEPQFVLHFVEAMDKYNQRKKGF